MKKSVTLILLIVIILSGVLFYSKTYYPSLPIDSVSKREVVKKVKNSNGNMVKITEENGYEWYIVESKQGKAYAHLKKMLEDEDWVYKEQLGAGFIFRKENLELIVGSEMWTSKYVIFQIPIGK